MLIILFSVSCNNNCEKECEKKCDAHKDSIKEAKASDQLMMSVLWYEYSAEMQACYYQTYNFAKILLDKNQSEYKGNKKTAVIVDVDETVLNNTPFEEKILETGILFSDSTWKQWTDLGIAKPLPGAVEFLKYAQSKGVETFYISNRKTSEVEATMKNLQNEGFPFADVEHLLFKEETSNKTARRNKVSENYEILLLIGDNLRDFDEIFKERETNLGFDVVKENKEQFGKKFLILPNPMYGEWEKAIYGGKYPKTEEEMLKLRSEKINSGY